MLEAPGYKRFEIRPVTGGDITRAEAVFESPYGLIKSAWHKTGDGIRVQIEIPANTTADVYLPGKRVRDHWFLAAVSMNILSEGMAGLCLGMWLTFV